MNYLSSLGTRAMVRRVGEVCTPIYWLCVNALAVSRVVMDLHDWLHHRICTLMYSRGGPDGWVAWFPEDPEKTFRMSKAREDGMGTANTLLPTDLRLCAAGRSERWS